MAKANVRIKKKVKKNVAEGIAHVHASFNNTLIDKCINIIKKTII